MTTLVRRPPLPPPFWLDPRTGVHHTLAVGDRVTFARWGLHPSFEVRTWGVGRGGAYVAGAFWSCLVQDIRSVEREGEGL